MSLTAQVPPKYRSGKWHEKNGTVNAQNLSVALGISLRTTKRDLYVLRDMNLIHYVGSDKTGHWEVIKESD